MEKRYAIRRPVELSAEVYTRGERIIAASAENLSDQGVCLAVDEPLDPETLVGVSLFPVDDGIEDPDAAPLNLPAQVVWCKGEGEGEGRTVAGMRIVKIDPR